MYVYINMYTFIQIHYYAFIFSFKYIMIEDVLRAVSDDCNI